MTKKKLKIQNTDVVAAGRVGFSLSFRQTTPFRHKLDTFRILQYMRIVYQSKQQKGQPKE